MGKKLHFTACPHMFTNRSDRRAARDIKQYGLVSVKVGDGEKRAVRGKAHFVGPVWKVKNIGEILRGNIPYLHFSIVASGVKLAPIPGKHNRLLRHPDGHVQKNGRHLQPGKVPEPDCVIDPPLASLRPSGENARSLWPEAGKVGKQTAIGEAPHPNVTIAVIGNEFGSSAVECEEADTRGHYLLSRLLV